MLHKLLEKERGRYPEQLLGIVRDTIRDRNDHIVGGSHVPNGLPKNSDHVEELIPIKKGRVGLVRVRPATAGNQRC